MNTMNIQVEPLMSQDFEWIESILNKYQEPDSIQTAFDLDGFITAIVISPSDIPPHIWLPFIFNDEQGAQWEDEEEEEKFIRLVMNWFYEVYASRQGKSDYNPMFPEIQRQGLPYIYVAPWSNGFLRGSCLWMDFDDMEEAAKPHFHELVMPALISTPDTFEEVSGEVLTPEQRDDWDDVFMDKISGLHGEMITHLEKLSHLWHPLKAQAPIKNESPKVGRNDPCPCNSGKKFKKCCG